MGAVVSAIGAAILSALPALIQVFTNKPTKAAEMPTVPGKTKEQLRAEAQKELGLDSVNHYNFAFCGGSGVGKSSMINVIRGLKDTDAAAAPIGVTETTQNITRYEVPGYPHVVLWDVPGAGTETHKAENYFMDKKLYAFDFLLIMTGNRVMEIDIALAKNSVEAKVPVAFVRSKSDVDLMNESEKGDCDISEIKQAYHQSISSYIRDQLPDGLKKQPLFVVSAKVFRMKKYAECKLDEDRLLEWVVHVAERRIQ